MVIVKLRWRNKHLHLRKIKRRSGKKLKLVTVLRLLTIDTCIVWMIYVILTLWWPDTWNLLAVLAIVFHHLLGLSMNYVWWILQGSMSLLCVCVCVCVCVYMYIKCVLCNVLCYKSLSCPLVYHPDKKYDIEFEDFVVVFRLWQCVVWYVGMSVCARIVILLKEIMVDGSSLCNYLDHIFVAVFRLWGTVHKIAVSNY